MAKFNVVDKRMRMGLYDIVKYQIATHCYVKRINMSESDLDCATTLAISGEHDLTEFCLLITEKRIFKSTQSVRNCLVKLERNNVIKKEGKTKKKIRLSPDLNILCSGNILIDYKFIHLGSEEAQGNT